MNDPEKLAALAKRNFYDGAILVFAKVPVGTEFGIDMKVWNTEENFRGIKMIPPGLHFIFYSAMSKSGEQAPRSGFFHYFKRGELVAKRYDPKTEDISLNDVPSQEIASLRANILVLDKFLGPYPFDIVNKWHLLTEYITEELVDRLAPTSGFIRSAPPLLSCSDADRPRGNLIQSSPGPSTSKQELNSKRKRTIFITAEDSLLPSLKPVPGTEIRFCKFPERNYPDGSTPAEITMHSLDSSYVLETILKEYKSLSDFIGELQFAFICFLIGHSLEAFEHWKALIGLICSCEAAIIKYRRVYDMFISVIEIHLEEIPEEFLTDIVANNNIVYLKLKTLFLNIQDSNVDGELKAKTARLKENLNKKFSWDFNLLTDPDDEAPIVVHIEMNE